MKSLWNSRLRLSIGDTNGLDISSIHANPHLINVQKFLVI